jgi:hypothetical protein
MNDPHNRRTREAHARAVCTLAGLLLIGGLLLVPSSAKAQVVAGGDFDICDYCGNVSANTVRLVGRAGFGTSGATLHLVNAATESQDVDNDGYTVGIDFDKLFIVDTVDFVNQADPAFAIGATNFRLGDFLNPLRNGSTNRVSFRVDIPEGTRAGTYRGGLTIRDSVRVPGVNNNGEILREDLVIIEIEVLPARSIEIVAADSAAPLDSLVIEGRPGTTATGVVRIANLGNVDLTDLHLESTDLVATSGTGLRIRRDRITFSPNDLSTLGFGDTVRVTVRVRIPQGLLAGRYRGELIAQGAEVEPRRIPFTVVVTTPGDIVFETNPVVGRAGDLAVIIFNADPGTRWELAVFDMMATTTFRTSGTVFEGTPGDDNVPPFEGDQAVRFTWPLVNGRGENVAGGLYYVVINAVQDGAQRQLRGKLMVIR